LGEAAEAIAQFFFVFRRFAGENRENGEAKEQFEKLVAGAGFEPAAFRL
jgi:hypothetical protein